MKHSVTKTLLVLALVGCMLFGMLGTVFAEEPQESELNALLSDIQGLMNKYGPEIPQEVKDGTEKGTCGLYETNANSYYVAIGDDSTAASGSYADLLAKDLGIKVKKLTEKELMIDQVSEKILKGKAAEIKKADLITLNFSVNSFARMAVTEIIGGKPSSLDWNKYVPEEGVAEIKATLADLKQYLVDSGVSGSLATGSLSMFIPASITKENALTTAAECFAYGTLAYAQVLPTVLDELHTMNPNARIVVVGMDNPLSGSAIKLSSGEAMDMGGYVAKLIRMTDECAQTATMEREYSAFVKASEAANEKEGTELSELDMIKLYLTKVSPDVMPNEAGHKYIVEQIKASFREPAPEITIVLGDVDGNGRPDYSDALKILRASIGLEELTEEQKVAADVNFDGKPDYSDALKILRASIGLETLEPKNEGHQNMTDLH